MSDKAKKIVEDLLNDNSLYGAMSKREGEVWGKVFSDERRNDALKEDQKAAFALKLNRDAIQLPAVLARHGLQPASGLSLACGAGRAERMLMSKGICKEFHGVDIAADALNEARIQATNQGLNITYEQADLNEVSLDKNKYDLVVTQNCLHHVLRLEHLAEQIHGSLRPGGALWISDYIGETQFQYTQERLDIVNAILQALPPAYHHDSVNQRTIGKIVKREPGNLISPFEAIRSEEIMPVFLRRFDVIEKFEANAFLDLVCPVGTRDKYLQSDEGRSIFELLFMFDRLLIGKKILPPRLGMYLLSPRPN